MTKSTSKPEPKNPNPPVPSLPSPKQHRRNPKIQICKSHCRRHRSNTDETLKSKFASAIVAATRATLTKLGKCPCSLVAVVIQSSHVAIWFQAPSHFVPVTLLSQSWLPRSPSHFAVARTVFAKKTMRRPKSGKGSCQARTEISWRG
ncbi:hypothetical protein TIFTF001_013987 [Ficus carica]|uniref:Uncharacterized protein n=1 Tax=Ficus carica TaxID=3494 RepID=A0AA88D6K0_FICCA|nr:hypothetical protein TIFTF001_013987 [Ficus carica]